MLREPAKVFLPLLLLAFGCPQPTTGEGDGGGASGSDAGGTVGGDGGTVVKDDAGNVVVQGDGGAVVTGDGGVVVTGDGGVVVTGDGGSVVTGDGSVPVVGDGGGVPDAGPGPWTLVAFSSTYSMDGGSQVELRSIDPSSGVSTLVKLQGQISWPSGVNAYAPALKRIHVMGGSTGDDTTHLFTVDAVTGALVSSPPVESMSPAAADGGFPTEYNWSGGLGVRSDGTLVGMTWWQGSDAGVEQVRTLDPATGATSLLGAVPGLEWVVWGGTGFDSVKDVFYVIGSTGADLTDHLYTVDAKTGAVLSSPALDTALAAADGGFGPSWVSGLGVRSDGTVVGVTTQYDTSGWGAAELRSVDPATGKTTVVKQVQGLSWVLSGESTLDRARDVIWLMGGFGQDMALRVVGIDARTGDVVASPVIDQASVPDGGTGPAWTGGLYVVR